MSFSAVDRAVAAQLLGVDAASLTPTEGERSGLAIPAVDNQSRAATKKLGVRKLRLDGYLFTDVPVYRFSARGRRVIEQWPCFSYELIGCQFAPQRYIWKADRFATPVASSYVQVPRQNKQDAYGPALLRVKDHPEPFDLMFDVRIWVKDVNQQMVLLQALLNAMPARGCVQGVLADGTRKSWELRLSTMTNVDDQEPTLENTQVRGFSWVYTYVVETHLDNSEATELVRSITSEPVLEMELKTSIHRQPVVALSIDPVQAAFIEGQAIGFSLVATYATGETEIVTAYAEWLSSDPSFLRPGAPGVFVGGSSEAEVDVVTVTAKFKGLNSVAVARGIHAKGDKI